MRLFNRAAILGTSQIINVLLTLVARLFFARILGTDLFGSYSAALQSMTLISRGANMGLAPSVQFHASRKEEPIGAVLGVALVWTLILGGLSAVGSWFWLTRTAGFSHQASDNVFATFLVCLPMVMMTVVLSVVLVPLGRVKAFGITQAGGMIPMIGVTAIALIWVDPLRAVVIGQVATWIYLFGFILWHLRDHLDSLRYDTAVAKRVLRFGLTSWPNLFLTVAVTRSTILLSAPYLRPEELSLLALAMQLAEGLLAPYGALGQLMLTETAQKGQDSRDTVARLMRLSTLLFAVILGVAAVGAPLVLLMAGPSYSGAYLPLLALVLVTSLHSRFRTGANVLGGLGQANAATVPLAVELVVLITLIFALGPGLGMVGIIGACILAAATSGIMMERKVRGAFSLGWRDLLWAHRADIDHLRSVLKLRRPKVP